MFRGVVGSSVVGLGLLLGSAIGVVAEDNKVTVCVDTYSCPLGGREFSYPLGGGNYVSIYLGLSPDGDLWVPSGWHHLVTEKQLQNGITEVTNHQMVDSFEALDFEFTKTGLDANAQPVYRLKYHPKPGKTEYHFYALTSKTKQILKPLTGAISSSHSHKITEQSYDKMLMETYLNYQNPRGQKLHKAIYAINDYSLDMLTYQTYFIPDTVTKASVIDVSNNTSCAQPDKDAKPFKTYMWGGSPDVMHGGYVRITRDGKVGFADHCGIETVEPLYDWASQFHEERATVCKGCQVTKYDGKLAVTGGAWGMIDTKGTITVPVLQAEPVEMTEDMLFFIRDNRTE